MRIRLYLDYHGRGGWEPDGDKRVISRYLILDQADRWWTCYAHYSRRHIIMLCCYFGVGPAYFNAKRFLMHRKRITRGKIYKMLCRSAWRFVSPIKIAGESRESFIIRTRPRGGTQ